MTDAYRCTSILCSASWGVASCGKPAGHTGSHYTDLPGDSGIAWGYVDE